MRDLHKNNKPPLAPFLSTLESISCETQNSQLQCFDNEIYLFDQCNFHVRNGYQIIFKNKFQEVQLQRNFGLSFAFNGHKKLDADSRAKFQGVKWDEISDQFIINNIEQNGIDNGQEYIGLNQSILNERSSESYHEANHSSQLLLQSENYNQRWSGSYVEATNQRQLPCSSQNTPPLGSCQEADRFMNSNGQQTMRNQQLDYEDKNLQQVKEVRERQRAWLNQQHQQVSADAGSFRAGVQQNRKNNNQNQLNFGTQHKQQNGLIDNARVSNIPNLFGRGDHLQPDQSLTAADSIDLFSRGYFLLLVFLPFVIIAPIVLISKLTANYISTKVSASYKRAASRRGIPSNHTRDMRQSEMLEHVQNACWWLLLQGCRMSGAAFIKWGQWACTREDLFPRQFCRILSELHDNAPVHAFGHSKQEVEKAFGGRRLEEVFEVFDEEPLASGSIAQVHKARMRINGEVQDVAVKICHPNVSQQISRDFRILKTLASLTQSSKVLRSLNLRESASNFSHTMVAQTDLRVEAVHILHFRNNFQRLDPHIRFPNVLFASPSVLIESFEKGKSVAHYIRSPQPVNTAIVSLGVDAYLKMLLLDNLIHTDLHPGNILVHESNTNDNKNNVNIVLLDCGLAEELTDDVRFHFISFLNMIVKGDGKRAAELILNWGRDQRDADVVQFTQDMSDMFERDCEILSDDGIDLDGVMKGVLKLARKHRISVDSKYAALVIGVCVLVGFAASMDKDVNLMDAAAPCLLYYNLTGRIIGRLYG